MNISFLVLLNILVLYFILRQQKRNCIECRHTITFLLVLVLCMYEIYMTLGYNKTKNKNNI